MSPKTKAPDIEQLIKDKKLFRGNNKRFKIDRIPFGIPDLDDILAGGIPRNRITIVSGEYSSGKSFMIQLLMKTSLENDLVIAYIDTERTYDPIWWEQVGLDTKNVLVSQPPYGEEGVDMAVALARSGVDVIALDSLAGLIPKAVTERKAEEKTIGAQAQLMNNMFQRINAVDHRTAFVCTNQLRSAIGPGPMDALPGGRGQNFFSHLMIRTRREGWIEEDGERVGFNMKIAVRKSKVGPAFGECSLPFRFRGEIDILSMLLDRALETSVVKQAGPWYFLFGEQGDPDVIKILGRNSVLQRMRDDEDLRQRLDVLVGDYDANSTEGELPDETD